MILVESGLNSKQVSLMRPIYIPYLITETRGLNSKDGLNLFRVNFIAEHYCIPFTNQYTMKDINKNE